MSKELREVEARHGKFHISDSKGRGEVGRGDRDVGTEKQDVLNDLQRGSSRSFQRGETRFRDISCFRVQII